MPPQETDRRAALGTAWERRTLRSGVWLGAGTLVLAAVVAFPLRETGLPLWLSLPLAAALGWFVYSGLTRKLRRRRGILAQPFPAEWEVVLQRDVVFFRTLEPAEQVRFRRDLQVFVGEKLITGIKTEVDTTTRVLAGASAVIPIFGFPEWEWDQITEVLIYPGRFDDEFRLGEGQRTLGMVGTGSMNRMMILSKPDLVQGFRNPGDKLNVGLHESAHLVDKADGAIDGRPEAGLDRRSIGPWVDLVRRKMEEIREGKSDLRPYALTNEAEFFAVATEYFFERPGIMERKHPELFAMMSRVFNQNLGTRLQSIAHEIKRGRRRFGRNSPCPCGSGVKYKRCCGRRR